MLREQPDHRRSQQEPAVPDRRDGSDPLGGVVRRLAAGAHRGWEDRHAEPPSSPPAIAPGTPGASTAPSTPSPASAPPQRTAATRPIRSITVVPLNREAAIATAKTA